MLDKIIDIAERYNMFSTGETVVCGLSGGADSVCLLLCMRLLSEKFGIAVEALHVNHCLRGSESDGDEEFCRRLCEKLNVPFTAVSCDVNTHAQANSLSTEEAARELRYGIFKEHSHGKKLATAHNADDALETLILNLTRGTALKGLAGIPPVRGNIVRPLLAVSRAEIEAFLAEKGQAFVTDSTNLSDDYTRNKIRHRIIPLMKELNPSLISTSVNSIEGLRSEDRFIESQTDIAEKKCLSGDTFTGLAAYDEVIRRRCISRLLKSRSIPVSHERLRECDNILVNSGKLNLSRDLYFVSDGKKAGITSIKNGNAEICLSSALSEGRNQIFDGVYLDCEIIDSKNYRTDIVVNKKLTFYLLDYDKIIGRAILRNRRFGDRIQLRGRSFTSSVKKLINEKIPPQERASLHFIEDDEGTIFAEKLGIAGRVAPDGDTRRFLRITVVRER